MKIFTSDWHCYHKNVRRLCDRPFESDEEMRETLINNYNSVATGDDDLYMLGDFMWSDSHINQVLPRLHFRNAYLIAGNHDSAHPMHSKSKKGYANMLAAGFTDVLTTAIVDIESPDGSPYKAKLSHFPYYDETQTAEEYNLRFREWRPKKEDFCHVLLHGHSHSKPDRVMRYEPLSLDCGVDGNFFQPYTEQEIWDFIYINRLS